jgi:hypothetical protein
MPFLFWSAYIEAKADSLAAAQHKADSLLAALTEHWVKPEQFGLTAAAV